MDSEHGELHPESAKAAARSALGYAAAFDGKGINWQSDEPWPHRMELAQALDWITDLGAMVLNLADRAASSEASRPQTSAPGGEGTAQGGCAEAASHSADLGECLSEIAGCHALAQAAEFGDVDAAQAVSEIRTRLSALYHGAFDRIARAAPTERTPLTDAARDVLAERERQVTEEGWTPEHDDEHGCGELARAAGAYALYAAAAMSLHPGIATSLHRSAAGAWPWDGPSKANASTERRNLVKAGALILAEIERLDRIERASRSEGGV